MEQQAYVYTIDPYPQQAPEHNRLHRFYELLREGKLTTSRCVDCGHLPWPPRVVCPECLSDNLEWFDLSSYGQVYVYTIQEVGLPLGYVGPKAFALIDLPEGVRLLTSIEQSDLSELKPGAKVELVVMDVPGNRVLPAFKLKQ